MLMMTLMIYHVDIAFSMHLGQVDKDIPPGDFVVGGLEESSFLLSFFKPLN